MTVLAKCPFCGRELAVHEGRIRPHLPEPWGARKCPGSGAAVEPAPTPTHHTSVGTGNWTVGSSGQGIGGPE